MIWTKSFQTLLALFASSMTMAASQELVWRRPPHVLDPLMVEHAARRTSLLSLFPALLIFFFFSAFYPKLCIFEQASFKPNLWMFYSTFFLFWWPQVTSHFFPSEPQATSWGFAPRCRRRRLRWVMRPYSIGSTEYVAGRWAADWGRMLGFVFFPHGFPDFVEIFLFLAFLKGPLKGLLVYFF